MHVPTNIHYWNRIIENVLNIVAKRIEEEGMCTICVGVCEDDNCANCIVSSPMLFNQIYCPLLLSG
jgi:hypothetical protein